MAAEPSLIAEWPDENLRVAWVGGLYLEHEQTGVLINAAEGTTERWLANFDPAFLQCIAFSHGEVGAVGGLIPLLCALERSSPLQIWTSLGEERPSYLVDAWSRGWPGRFPVAMDAEFPGAKLHIGAFRIDTLGLGPPAHLAFRIHIHGIRIGFFPCGLGMVPPWAPLDLAIVVGSIHDLMRTSSLQAAQCWGLDERGLPLSVGDS